MNSNSNSKKLPPIKHDLAGIKLSIGEPEPVESNDGKKPVDYIAQGIAQENEYFPLGLSCILKKTHYQQLSAMKYWKTKVWTRYILIRIKSKLLSR
jgi:hypothetical protein